MFFFRVREACAHAPLFYKIIPSPPANVNIIGEEWLNIIIKRVNVVIGVKKKEGGIVQILI